MTACVSEILVILMPVFAAFAKAFSHARGSLAKVVLSYTGWRSLCLLIMLVVLAKSTTVACGV